jgi:hypothetical protein
MSFQNILIWLDFKGFMSHLYLPISKTSKVTLKTSGYRHNNETNYLERSHQGIQRAINPSCVIYCRMGACSQAMTAK